MVAADVRRRTRSTPKSASSRRRLHGGHTTPGLTGRAGVSIFSRVIAMKTLLKFLLVSAMALLSVQADAHDWKVRLAEARSTERIRNFYGKFSEFGTVQQ